MRALAVMILVLAANAPALAQGSYKFSDQSTVETHGDTVHWFYAPLKAPGRVDTSIFIIRKDSTVRLLRPAPARELPPEAAKAFRFLLTEAKASTDFERRLELIRASKQRP
ncbi:MAG: hypothetical protein ABIY52_03780 [Gemmatimonadaceae bacterium]